MAGIDPSRLSAELAADESVIESLRANGDLPHMSRPVDVRFVGTPLGVQRLGKTLEETGWSIIGTVNLGEGKVALDVQRVQTADLNALKALTTFALEAELKYGVRYDGWGTVATTGEY